MSLDDLTGRQREVLRFIQRSIGERGIPPTLREIGDALGMASTNAVADHLKALEKKGRIRRGSLLSRGIQVIEGEPDDPCVAALRWLVGQVRAGNVLDRNGLAALSVAGLALVDLAVAVDVDPDSVPQELADAERVLDGGLPSQALACCAPGGAPLRKAS